MDQYLSLADAWAQFWAKEAPPILQNRLLARPPAPSKKFLKDPKTEKSYESPQQGQEFSEGNTPLHVVEQLISKFREVVVYPLESATFVRSSSGKFTRAELSEWWPNIKGLLAEKYTVILGDWAKDRNEQVNIYDGGPLSWSAYRAGREFPVEIFFDPREFEKLTWSKEAAIESLNDVAIRLYKEGVTDMKRAWEKAKSGGIICTREEFDRAWKHTPSAGKQGPKGPRKNMSDTWDN